MPLRREGGRGLRRLAPSSHKRSESRHKIIQHPDIRLGEKAIKKVFVYVPAEGI